MSPLDRYRMNQMGDNESSEYLEMMRSSNENLKILLEKTKKINKNLIESEPSLENEIELDEEETDDPLEMMKSSNENLKKLLERVQTIR